MMKTSYCVSRITKYRVLHTPNELQGWAFSMYSDVHQIRAVNERPKYQPQSKYYIMKTKFETVKIGFVAP